MRSVLGIITARAGSKRLPGKNLLPFEGLPLIAWSVKAGLESGVIDRLVVSTDAESIASVCREHGAEAPFLRPPELATDTASSVDVLIHVLDTLAASDGYVPTAIVLLQPTSPLRTASHVREAMALFQSAPGTPSVISVTASKPPTWIQRVSVDGTVSPAVDAATFPPLAPGERFALPNGALYVAETAFFRREKSLVGPGTRAYEMPFDASVDIDTAEDFALAELLARRPLPPLPRSC